MGGYELEIPKHPSELDPDDPKHKWDHVDTTLPTMPPMTPGTQAAPPTFVPPWKPDPGGPLAPKTGGGLPKVPGGGGPEAPPAPNLLGGDVPGLADSQIGLHWGPFSFMPWLPNPFDKKDAPDVQPAPPTMDPSDMTPYQSSEPDHWWEHLMDLF
jgi:hypothetical protein